MPKIPTYDAPNLGLTPSDRGVNADVGAARRIGRLKDESAAALDRVAAGTRQIGAETERLGSETAREGNRFAGNLAQGVQDAGRVAVDYADHQQVAAGAAHGAQMFQNLDQSMNAAIKSVDPNDPAYGPKVEAAVKQWREQNVEPALEQFKDGFTTEASQKWAEQFVDRTRQHMFESSSAEVSTASGIGIKNAIHTTVNVGSNVVNADPTPSTLRAQFDLLDHSIDGMVASSSVRGTAGAALRSDLRQESKEKLVKSAVMGFIQKTGQIPVWSGDPEFAPYVNGPEQKQFQTVANAQQRANLLTQKTLEDHQHAMAIRAGKDKLAKVQSDNISYDETGKPSIKPGIYKEALAVAQKSLDRDGNPISEVMDHAKTLINYAQSQLREKREVVITNPQVLSSLYDKMGDPEKPTTDVDIMKAASNPDLSKRIDDHDTKNLMGLYKSLHDEPIKNPQFANAMKGVQAMLGDGDRGKAAFAKFYQEFAPEVQRQERESKLLPGSLSLSDENSLLRKTLKPYELPPKEKLLDHFTKNMGIGVAPTPELMESLSASPSSKPAVPPPEERESGKVYHTPKGPKVWIKTNAGQGWK